jgi:hypothetical protein
MYHTSGEATPIPLGPIVDHPVSRLARRSVVMLC